MFSGRENNVPGHKEEGSIAVTTFAEIETTSAFKVREGLASDLETQSRSEWIAYVGYWVNEGDVVEKLWSGGPGEDRLHQQDVIC